MKRADRQSLQQWRRQQRTALLERRMAMQPALRKSRDAAIEGTLHAALMDSGAGVISLYWPFKGEFNTRSLMRRLVDDGVGVALPAVVEPKAPLVFYRWHPGAATVRGVYGIPVPQAVEAVTPEAVVAPLVGFDRAGYRLGYGGGYYDRTLAALEAAPLVVGVGYELSAIDTIHPEPHDIAMHVIVTEAGRRNVAAPETAARAKPADPAHAQITNKQPQSTRQRKCP